LILPAFYLPNLHYFATAVRWEEVSISEVDVYKKRYFYNQSRIKISNQNLLLTVPIEGSRFGKTIKDLKICYSQDWVKLHIKSIESGYRKTAYYDFYAQDVISLIERKPVYLFDLNYSIIEYFCKCLKINCTTCQEPSEFMPEKEESFQIEPYYQAFGEFTGDISFLDILLNCNANDAKERLLF